MPAPHRTTGSGAARLLQARVEQAAGERAELEVRRQHGRGRPDERGRVALGLLERGHPALVRQLVRQPRQRDRLPALRRAAVLAGSPTAPVTRRGEACPNPSRQGVQTRPPRASSSPARARVARMPSTSPEQTEKGQHS